MTKGDVIVILRLRPLAQKNVDCFVGRLLTVADSDRTELRKSGSIHLCHHFLDDIFILNIMMNRIILHCRLCAFNRRFLVTKYELVRKNHTVESILEVASKPIVSHSLLTFCRNFIIDSNGDSIRTLKLPAHIIVRQKIKPLYPTRFLGVCVRIRIKRNLKNISILNTAKLGRCVYPRIFLTFNLFDNLCHVKDLHL